MVSPILTFGLLGVAALVNARLPDGRHNANQRPMAPVPKISHESGVPLTDKNGATLPPTNTTYYFNQLVDHTNPSAGTFSQRYWSTWQFWETGGCVVIMTPGEANAQGYDGYLTNVTINGQIAQQHNCATVVIEHRFFGLSNPKPDLSVSSLSLLTIDQAIGDLDYFAKNVKLPFPGGDKLNPATTPWVLIGGSYSGALTSWTMTQVDSFWAGYSSSGVVQSIEQYWQYFEPIRRQMPKNCSADVEAVIAHIDTVFTFGTKAEQQSIKNLFGMGDVKHLNDVSGALRSNLWDWQSIQPTTGSLGVFGQFCDALEVKNGTNAPASGFGVQHALTAWGNFWTTSYYAQICGDQDAETCFTSYNSTFSYYTDTSIDQAGRSWEWFVCTQVGWFQDGAPLGTPSLVTRLVTPADDLRACSFYFPQHYQKAGLVPPTTAHTNAKYQGWNVRVPRLFFGTGRNDPWKESTVASDYYNYPNTTDHPVGLGNGFHCSDLLTREGTADATVLAVQKQGLAAMQRWIPQFKPAKAVHARSESTAPVRLRPFNSWTGGVNPVFHG